VLHRAEASRHSRQDISTTDAQVVAIAEELSYTRAVTIVTGDSHDINLLVGLTRREHRRGHRQLTGHGSAETERAGFEPAMEFYPHTRLAGECLQPLGHLSLEVEQTSLDPERPRRTQTWCACARERPPKMGVMPNLIEDFKQRFSPQQRVAIVSLGFAELALKLAAARDIQRRTTGEIRGSKLLWRCALLINTFGPLGYFLFGRRKA
jgi:hypothetical protein